MKDAFALFIMVAGILVFLVAMWCIHWILGLVVTSLAAIRLGWVIAFK